MNERHDQEVVNALLRRYYAAARRVIESYGGTVEKYIGDAVVAAFGVPALHEDDPERAVRAGLRLVDEIDALPGIGDEPLQVRVGVNTGEVLVALDVDPASGEGFLIGDAVNVAARLQSAAPPMAVAVGETTHAATEKVFSFDACHPVALKGKNRPMQAWIAIAPLARTGSELRSFSSSFVGREEELALLQELLDAAAGRSPRYALIVGEPGIGKSRLLAEFARRLDDQPTVVTWRQGRCLPFGSGVTFWALSEIVRSSAGILESDGVARSEARLETSCRTGRSAPACAPACARSSAWRLKKRRARRTSLPGVSSSKAWLCQAPRCSSSRICTGPTRRCSPSWITWRRAAPTPRCSWWPRPAPKCSNWPARAPASWPPPPASRSARSPARRPPSSPAPASGAKSLPTDLQALILERSGGNPLFAEELVRLLEDRGLLEGRGGKVTLKEGVEVPMPDSIGALIAARLDLLSPERKALLSDAAVVGRIFWAGAVAAVGALEPAGVLEGLMELVAKELVSPVRGSSIEGETEFLFVHALVCDVAYAQLTRADRAAKHAALARWLEERTAGRTEDLAEVLAYHYGTALEMASSCGLFELEDELSEPTTRYLALAGGRAAPLDSAAAAAHFARAERVADEAARPKRRWLLSRRTRRTLRRRAPLLVAAVAVIAVCVVAGLAIRVFALSGGASGPVKLTASEIAAKYGRSVVDVIARVPKIVNHRITWKTFQERGVVGSKDGLIFANGLPLADPRVQWWAQVVKVGFFGSDGEYRVVQGQRLDGNGDRSYAIFKVDPEKVQLVPIPWGDPMKVKKGDPIVVLGRMVSDVWNASGVVRSIDHYKEPKLKITRVDEMRTAADLPTQAAGCPVIDTTGHLIGVTGHLVPLANYYKGDNVVIASTIFTNAAAWYQRLEHGGPTAWLGVSVNSPKAKTTSAAIKRDGGLTVRFVAPGGPAAVAGIRGSSRFVVTGRTRIGWQWPPKYQPLRELRGGDVITSADGSAIKKWMDLYNVMYKHKPGDVVGVGLLRRGRPMTFKVTLQPYRVFSFDWL